MPKWYFDEETEEFKGDALYFVQEGEDGPIKIGRGNAVARLQGLQVGNPRPLRLIGTIPNAGVDEAFWHSLFDEFRLKGEWFQPAKQLLNAIKWALAGEHWADERRAPEHFDQEIFSECMLDAYEMYMSHVFDGMSEAKAAAIVVSVAYDRAMVISFPEMREVVFE